MLFPSIEFGIFLVIVLVLSWSLAAIEADRLHKWFLLAASLFFYGFWSIRFALLLVAVATAAYLVALANERVTRPGGRRLILALGVAAALTVLGWFKYYNFLLSVLINAGLFRIVGFQPPFIEAEIPVAISFFTFHAISYMVDAYRGRMRPTRSLADVVLYVSFFPHLVAGPIVRAADFMPQLQRRPTQTALPYSEALALIVGGLFKKVVFANYLSVAIVEPVFIAPAQFNGGDLLLAIFAYTCQIYFDFSAYTGIAIGVAALLGYRFPENFNQPYRSLSPREFWTRWHITLSTWLRDYLYIPLGGNRHGGVATVRNLMITMILGGLWHGANVTFALWGALHGLALVANHLWMATRLRDFLQGRAAYRAACLVAMTIFIGATWVFFRSPDLATALEVFRGIWQRPGVPGLATPFLAAILVLGVAGQFISPAFSAAVRRRLAELSAGLQIAGFSAAMSLLLIVAPSASAPFIYFQF
jgi:D-alanyl-lipoteichoic acid acyltransferase DltB (MBOAT superfamily)